MKKLKMLTFALVAINVVNAQSMKYPVTKRGNIEDEYFGVKVSAPYRWLENDQSKVTKKWIKKENKLTFEYLNRISFKNQINEQITKLWNYEKFSVPFEIGKYTYYFKNNGLQAQSVLYRKLNKGGKDEVFLDPNNFSKDGTSSLGGIVFNKNCKLAAYQISEGGSDWRKVVVINTETGQQVGDTLMDVKFSEIAWKEGEGLYYSSYDKPKEGSQLSGKTEYHKLYYHKLGESQEKDQLIFGGEDNPRRYVKAEIIEGGRFLIISAANSTSGNELYFKDLKNPNFKIQAIVKGFANTYKVQGVEGDNLFIQTNYNAPNQRLVKVNINKLEPENWLEIIPETEAVLNITKANKNFFATYIVDVHSEVKQYDYNGKLIRNVELPGIGQVTGFKGKSKQKEIYYTFTNYIYPATIFKYNSETGVSDLYKKPELDFNSEDYISKQVFYTSEDGTKVPMTITYLKTLKLDGKNPTILYGYGGFNISLLPSFSPATVVWLKNGGIYAVANLRGGGEYGRKWHDAGTKLNKKNVFNDFIAAGEYLINNKYTSSEYLAISGGSNGGLLVGATMTLRPDLAKVAFPAVGVLDMLRYHTFTAGAGWVYDYGTANDSKEMFEYLKSYSPVDNVKKGICYPATLITTGDHDDRVVPSHSYKFAAELQHNQKCKNPALIRIETKAGHGAGKPTDLLIEETADKFAFALYNFGITKLKN